MMTWLNHEAFPLDAALQEAWHALVDPDAKDVAQAVQAWMSGSHGHHADELILIGKDRTA